MANLSYLQSPMLKILLERHIHVLQITFKNFLASLILNESRNPYFVRSNNLFEIKSIAVFKLKLLDKLLSNVASHQPNVHLLQLNY